MTCIAAVSMKMIRPITMIADDDAYTSPPTEHYYIA